MQRPWIFRAAWAVLCTLAAPWVLAAWLVRKMTGSVRFTFIDALADSLRFVGGYLFFLSLRFQTREFFIGLPSLAVLCCIGIASFFALRPVRSLEDDYRVAAAEAFSDKDYAAAEVCLRRLAALDGGARDSLFAQARTAEALGEIDRCESIMLGLAPMSELAPNDGEGFGPAHVWLASHMLKTRVHSLEVLQAAERHLIRAIGRLPDVPVLHERLGEVYLEMGKAREAAEQLTYVVEADRSRALVVAQLYAVAGQPKQASRLAIQAAEYWESQLVDNPSDRRARLQRVGALLFSERFSEAVECAKAAPKIDAEISHLLAEVYVVWAGVTFSKQGASERVAELLALALEAEPFNLTAVDRLARWHHVPGKGSQRLERAFRELNGAATTANALITLAGVSTSQGHLLAARSYLERAHAIDPKSIPAANNLAWHLSQYSTEFPRALELIDAAVEASSVPRAELYDTRAEILMKSGRWDEAVSDLALALNAAPRDAWRRWRFLIGCARYLAADRSPQVAIVQATRLKS